jgi:hypothetical protein
MQPEQTANLAALERKGIAIRVPKMRDPSKPVQAAIQQMLHNEEAKQRRQSFPKSLFNGTGRNWPRNCCSRNSGRASNRNSSRKPQSIFRSGLEVNEHV